MTATGDIPPFVLDASRPQQLAVPAGLIERDHLLDEVAVALDTASAVIVSGPQGVGRSSVAAGALESLDANRVVLTAACPANAQPLAPVLSALRGFLKGLFALDAAALDRWRGPIASAVVDHRPTLSALLAAARPRSR